ncbi:hypothetical protein AX769_12490 [Frondihabitans sp. PAMC 28766]|uniref:LuxR C-terminal-related transcriptional regulator n=1 Tax=Frondihabitans sp. PAMC 28766 TaxID=1795630 RepID=UPI00078BAEBF|nr:LuxR C-terminal-related transcriptional regulator [Frondihabitans sp. PAMC 28766]AMM20809.1 hypothetical protein AX769_12490 [Frondihabitans sp. PAMC 28766]
MTLTPDAPGTDTTRSEELAILSSLAADLAGQFRLEPLLTRILTNAVQLLGCDSGSLCTIDELAHTYRKEVDLGVGCHAGSVFPLDEGVTGAVVRAGGTVVFDDYSAVPGGHVDATDDRYRMPVIGVPIRLDAHVIGACIVFADREERRFTRADAELLELFATHASVAIANSRLHTLLGERRQAIAVAAERERTVRDVHDSVARTMAEVVVHLDAAARKAEQGDDTHDDIVKAREAVRQSLAETERSADRLGPDTPDVISLEEAVGHELDWVATTAGVRTQLVVVGERRPVQREVSREVLRIVQEALTNVVAHARATSVRLGLVHSPDGVGVIVEDDGVGFDATSRVTGWGLSGLSARARQIGGTVQIDSTPEWGTRIRVDLPRLPARAADDATTPRLRVVVLHEHALVRAGVVRLLGRAEPGLRVVAEFSDAAIALEGIAVVRPDVVVADLDLPGVSAPELMHRLAALDPEARVVFLVSSRDDARISEAALAGARGFVERGADAVSLGRAVMAAADGDAVLSGDLISRLGAPAEDRDALTARERQVRDLVARGLPDKLIAIELGISPKTVEKHVGTILRKTGAHNRTELAALAGGH